MSILFKKITTKIQIGNLIHMINVEYRYILAILNLYF